MYYVAFHSWSQVINVPYSNLYINETQEVPNFDYMLEIGTKAAKAIEKRHGTVYEVGLASQVMYAMSGTASTGKQAADIPVAYLIELRDKGSYGFILPTDQSIPNNLEIIDGLLEMDQATRDLKYYERSAAGIAVTPEN